MNCFALTRVNSQAIYAVKVLCSSRVNSQAIYAIVVFQKNQGDNGAEFAKYFRGRDKVFVLDFLKF